MKRPAGRAVDGQGRQDAGRERRSVPHGGSIVVTLTAAKWLLRKTT
jgi:hypothetical protein